MKSTAPYGSWSSTIHADLVASVSTKINDARVFDESVYWCEVIANEKGRNAIMRHDGEHCQCILPRPLSAKSKVHEYGGSAYLVEDEVLYFVLADDQRIYRAQLNTPKFEPEPLTPPGDFRFADLCLDKTRHRLIAVAEEHRPEGLENALYAIPLDASQQIYPIAQGHDFYSNPCISPDGQTLAFLTWDHPDLPWDATILWLATLTEDGIEGEKAIAGQDQSESIFCPKWSPKGDLAFVSDRNEWWNLFIISASTLQEAAPRATCILPYPGEFATPQWVFGMSTYGFLDANTLLATCTQDGNWKLAQLSLREGLDTDITWIQNDSSLIESVHCNRNTGVFIGASPSSEPQVFQYQLGHLQQLSQSSFSLGKEEISEPLPFTFPTTNDDQAFGLFYAPKSSQYCGPTDELPPVIVICHGGPTGQSDTGLNLKIQYWTNRGFAVADINYRGSRGYGRSFRRSLEGQWGVFDVDDVCMAVEYLAAENKIDANKSIIKGSSAGGYTVLAALAFRDTFAAGVSLYGIGDLAMLAEDTHKFEARYLDKLIAPYPQNKDIYTKRSPIFAYEDIACPLLLFQGLLDKVVPPNQAEAMFSAVKDKGLPVAYVTYEDEAHGFRNCKNICHMLEAEWQFYSAIFGFPLPEEMQSPLTIHNVE